MWTTLIATALAGSDVDAGVEFSEMGDWSSAVERLDSALADPGSLKGKDKAAAYAHRARARTELVPERNELAIGAASDVVSARKADGKGQHAALLDETAETLLAHLVVLGGNAVASEPAEARDFLAAAIDVDADHYEAHRLTCNAAYGLEDTALAKAHCERTLDLADEGIAAFDVSIATTAQVLVWTYTAMDPQDLAAAGVALDRSASLLDAYDKRMMSAKDMYEADDWTRSRAALDTARATLDDLLTKVSLADPAKAGDALATFEKAIAASPDDLALRLQYASALSKTDRHDDTDAAWQAAIDRGADSFDAHFGFGATLGNRAVVLNGGVEGADDATYDKLMAEITALMGRARPLLERAHELDAAHAGAIGALAQACGVLQDDACVAAMKAKQ